MRKTTGRAMVLLSIIALVLSCFLCIHAFLGRGLVGCAAGSSCNEVLGSRWSFIMGRIPVSGLAALCYIVMTMCLLWRRSFDADPQFANRLERGMMVLSGAILGAAIWFIYLQKSMIRAFCPYCMTVHVCGIVLTVLVAVSSSERLGWRMMSILVGLMLAGGLAGFQLLTTPRTAYDRGFVPEALPLPDPQEMPVVGNPAAEKTVTLMFDYRCSHCRKIHSLLPEVVQLLGGEVAIVTAPVPLSQECNPYIPAGEDRFKGSCELTRYAMALWRCSPEAHAQFDAWLFEAEGDRGWRPRESEEAYVKACSLVGESRLQQALEDPWLPDYISRTCELFGRTSSSEKSAIPRFIYGDRWIVPDVDDAEGLASLIRSILD